MNELLRRVLHLPAQSSSVARDIDALHYTVILATMAGVTLAAVIAGVFLVRYRRRTPVAPLTPRITVPLWFEVVVYGGLLILFCAWWVVGFAQYRDIETAPADAMPIYVTAKQWMWKFAYPDGPTSQDALIVPVGRPVKLILTSRDVIHSFYVPEFRLKQDVVPGRAETLWFEATAPGSYDVLCAQYCGLRHSLMRCFRYDPANRRYGLFVARFMQLGDAVVLAIVLAMAWVFARHKLRRARSREVLP
ncbi:MAG TPA: hypothetical protein VF516_05465 [Kofleriaceae bacterium]